MQASSSADLDSSSEASTWAVEPPSVDTDSHVDLEIIFATDDYDTQHDDTVITLGTDGKSERLRESGTDSVTLQQDIVGGLQSNETKESECTEHAVSEDIIYWNDKGKRNESKRPKAK